ncbi:hypothetical protein GUJ93_ZPchr0013g37892 [Zizania palustris]|uniref:Uncharacterized protein n=1 Tax=Zizania palustris TaxID=103762 RepID=A0A8J5WVW7_ZIZPA|nr:hypothetical protein GUJ93_ZPchr0013g37892 [Zizania palustris]
MGQPSTGRNGDGDATGDWSSRFPELAITSPGAGSLTAPVGDCSSRFPEGLASSASRPGPRPSSATGDAKQSPNPPPLRPITTTHPVAELAVAPYLSLAEQVQHQENFGRHTTRCGSAALRVALGSSSTAPSLSFRVPTV